MYGDPFKGEVDPDVSKMLFCGMGVVPHNAPQERRSTARMLH